MRSYDFVEMYKEKNNLPSDYKAAIALGVSRQSISHYKNGRPLDEDLALPLAQNLGIEPSEILYVIAAERSHKPETRKAFLKLVKLSKQAGRATANLLNLLAFSSVLSSLVYILC